MDMESPNTPSVTDLATGSWRLDPEHSRVEFAVRHFYGLITVKGHFDHYEGHLELGTSPAIELVIEATSLDTGNAKRDKHLRSADFFDLENHPEVRFVSETAVLDGDVLRVRGTLEAAGKQVPLQFDAELRSSGGGLEIAAATEVDHRELGMTWSPLGIMRAPSRLIVSGRLLRADEVGEPGGG
jgi:polyisoprenoid-binding protein YceI